MNEGLNAVKVLLVDDEQAISSLLSAKLSQQGFDCSTATSGKEGLALMTKSDFDVVISDLNMPGMSGFDFLREVGKNYKQTAFLMATGEDDVGTGVEAMKWTCPHI